MSPQEQKRPIKYSFDITLILALITICSLAIFAILVAPPPTPIKSTQQTKTEQQIQTDAILNLTNQIKELNQKLEQLEKNR